MVDRLKSSSEFEASNDPDVSLHDLLNINIDEETRLSLVAQRLNIFNDQALIIMPSEDIIESVSIGFRFYNSRPWSTKASIKGAVVITQDRSTQMPEITSMEVEFPGKDIIWRYSKNPDSPKRYTIVSLPNSRSVNKEGYRRIRSLGSNDIVFNRYGEKIEDETRDQTLLANTRSLKLCSYVLKTAIENPSLLQQFDNSKK